MLKNSFIELKETLTHSRMITVPQNKPGQMIELRLVNKIVQNYFYNRPNLNAQLIEFILTSAAGHTNHLLRMQNHWMT